MSVPHFDIPFRFASNGHAITVEQDSLEEVSNCVEAILRTHVGQRHELPSFGIVDPTFETQPLQLQAIIDKVLEQEPRAALLMSQAPDQFNQLVARVSARVSVDTEEVGNA